MPAIAPGNPAFAKGQQHLAVVRLFVDLVIRDIRYPDVVAVDQSTAVS
jgi:hypothetical protein